MNRSLIANRYAKALFKIAIEQGSLDTIHNDMVQLQSYCNEAEGFTDLLMSPVIKPGQKREVLRSVLENKLEANTIRFLNLLIDNKREVLLEDIIRVFITMYKTDKGIKTVTLYSAVELDQKQVDSLVDFLRQQFNSAIELNLKVNPELLGGFKLTVDGKMADTSLSSKLKNMKKQLLS